MEQKRWRKGNSMFIWSCELQNSTFLFSWKGTLTCSQMELGWSLHYQLPALQLSKKPFLGIKELFSLHNHKNNYNKSHACVLDGCAHRQKMTNRKSPIGGVSLSYADKLHSSHELSQFLGLNGIISVAISLLTFNVQFVIWFFKCQNVMLAYILSNVKELPPKDP